MKRIIIFVATWFLCTSSFAQADKKSTDSWTAAMLSYKLPDSTEATGFYEEVSFAKGADSKILYVKALGFEGGSMGFTINKSNVRGVTFTRKNTTLNSADPSVKLKAKGENVEEKFGNCFWKYNWKADSVYKFYLHTLSDSATSTTIYTGYFFVPELQRWKLLASYASSNNVYSLTNLSSIMEFNKSVFTAANSKVYLGKQWIFTKKGEWVELTSASFSKLIQGKPLNNLLAGVDGDKFTLAKGPNGMAVKQGSELSRLGTKKPVIDVMKNVDSVAQWKKDKAEISLAVKAGKFDTTGSKDGVYYKILKQGAGDQVKVTDTVTVRYKGSLLKDGSVFDETKGDDVATFPLSRLIRGWQSVVPFLKVGGKIRALVPSAMAYSIRSRSKDIPPNSVLVFDVEVLSVKK